MAAAEACFESRPRITVKILGFDINAKEGEHTVEVYTKSGHYKGFEKNRSAWTLIQTVKVWSNGKDKLTPLVNLPKALTVNKDSTQSFYVKLNTHSLRYTKGNNEDWASGEDQNIRIMEGCGKSNGSG